MGDDPNRRQKRQGNYLSEPGDDISGWLFLSFADDGFLGAAIVQGADIEEAAQRAWQLGINPGGQVLGCRLPVSVLPPPEFRNKLLSRSEANEAFQESGGTMRLGDAENVALH